MKAKMRNMTAIIAAILALVLGVFLFTACDNGNSIDERRYTYSHCECPLVEGTPEGEYMEAQYNQTFAGSEAYFENGKFCWEWLNNGALSTASADYTEEEGQYLLDMTDLMDGELFPTEMPEDFQIEMTVSIEGDTLTIIGTLDGTVGSRYIFTAQ